MRGCSRGRAPEHQRKMPCGVPRRLAPGSSSPMAGASHDNSIGSPKSTPSRVASGATCVQRSYVSYVNDTSERVPSRLKSPLWPALSSPILRGVSSPSGRSAAPALAPGRSGGCGRPTRDTLGAARPPAGAAGGCQGARSRSGGAKVLVKFLIHPLETLGCLVVCGEPQSDVGALMCQV